MSTADIYPHQKKIRIRIITRHTRELLGTNCTSGMNPRCDQINSSGNNDISIDFGYFCMVGTKSNFIWNLEKMMSWRCFTCWLVKLWCHKMTSLVNKSADWPPNYHKILIFSPPKSLKRLRAARIDELADSNEPAMKMLHKLLCSISLSKLLVD